MNQESAEVKLYKRIMKEVKLMIETQAIQTEIGARNTDMKVVVDEMAWAPTMLSNVKNDENKHVLLMYHMMIQHDIAKIAEKILSSNFGKDESSQPKEIWQVRASWSEAMVPIAFQMMMMQVNLIMEIQRHAGDEGRRAAEDRLNVVLASYKRFFGQHYPKVQAKKKSDMEAALAWNGYTYEKSRRRPTPRTCGYVAHGKSCTFEDENACATMACIWRSARYPCTDPNIKHSICTSSNLQSFWQTHQLPKIQKQRNLAQVLYDRKLMEEGLLCKSLRNKGRLSNFQIYRDDTPVPEGLESFRAPLPKGLPERIVTSDGERETERERERVCVCVCGERVCVRVSE